MITFHIITLFPEMFSALTASGITARAFNQGLYRLHTYNPRDFSDNKHRKVDDTPFGGGAGMVMMPQPLAKTVEFIRKQHGDQYVILLSPQGVLWQQALASEYLERFSTNNLQITLVCGRYDGIDQRFIDHYVDQEISLGEFVVSGGELPAMMMLDSIIRLIPNAVGNPDSLIYDSFSAENNAKDQFDYPQYTQPRVFEGVEVPAVLLGGHHLLIDQWRANAAKEKKQQQSQKIEKSVKNIVHKI
jgi:tRNA (guanine37-N1)-methyltransferase